MKLWDGRFKKPMDSRMEKFGNSLDFDKELAAEDITASIAWAAGLRRAGVLNRRDHARIAAGLRGLLKEAGRGRLSFAAGDEDIHMAVERLLTARIGPAGGRLHTGRSRNDQVATDTRLYVKKALSRVRGRVAGLQQALIGRAERDRGVIVPAYTHLQQAQPVLLSHYWLSFFFALQREQGRLAHALATCDSCPLGAGAVAGSGFRVDRRRIARDLGFSAVMENSIDAVASRDFVLETLAAAASLGVLLSRYAEDLVIWSSKEFGFVELDDAWSSGSSMMPQKKNPDSLELVRGKSGRLLGNWLSVAAALKGVGLAYGKDMQEDKEPLFDSIAQIEAMLGVFAGVLRTVRVNANRIRENLDPFLLATDLADYLVRKEVPFREAHRVVGRLVAHCMQNRCDLSALSLPELQSYHPGFGRGVRAVFSWEHALSNREVEGGTGRQSVARQIALAKKLLSGLQ